MKTFYFPLEELFKKGLRPRTDMPANGKFLLSCDNAKPSPQGLIEVSKFTRSFNLNEDAYVFECFAGIFVLTATKVYSYANSVLTEELADIPENFPWDCADFRGYIVFTNGLVNVIRSSAGTFSIDDGTALPVAKTICNFRGRAFVGNLKYDVTRDINWGDTNWVGWSEIGYLEFPSPLALSTNRKNTGGFMPMPWEGNVYKVLPLGKAVIVYGNGGVTALPMATVGPVSTFGQKHLSDLGVIGELAVTANGKEDAATKHYFVRVDGMLCSIDLDLKVTELGYNEFLL